MTYMSRMNSVELRREIACRINGGREIGHGLSRREFYELLIATPKFRDSDLTIEEWDEIRVRFTGNYK